MATIKIYDLPNGRKYFIHKRSNTKYWILTLITADDILKKEDNQWVSKTPYKYKLQDRWSFISDADSMDDALQTLCLFAHHNPKDTKWLENYSYDYDCTHDFVIH
jgi:hypothetical protein